MTYEVPTIAIVCRSDRHARGKVAEVGLFGLDQDGRWRLWPFGQSGYRPIQTLDHETNEQFDPFDASQGSRPRHVRERYVLRCNLCKTTLTRRPGARLNDALNQFLEQDRRVVTLADLAASLG
jgi:hypothetical protein